MPNLKILDPISDLTDLRRRLVDGCVSIEIAMDEIRAYADRDHIRRSKWWKNERAKILKDACEQCGAHESRWGKRPGQNGPLVIQHFYHPKFIEEALVSEGSRFDAVLAVIDQNIDYFSFKDTATFCARCANQWDRYGSRLCPKCKSNYAGFQYETCYECHIQDRIRSRSD